MKPVEEENYVDRMMREGESEQEGEQEDEQEQEQEREREPEQEQEREPEDMVAGEDSEEEGRKPAGLRAPKVVSKEEREEHERTHIPYRSWCRACVRGRCRKRAHRQRSEEDKAKDRNAAVPRISMDYHFMSRDDEEAKTNPMLTMLNESTGDRYMRAVGRKGMGSEGRWIGW